MELARPEVLLLAVPVGGIVVAFAVFGRIGAPSRLRAVLATASRLAALGLLLLALSGPHRQYVVTEPTGAILLADRSASVSPDGRAEEERLLASLEADSPVRVLPFGDEAGSDPRPALLLSAALDAGRAVLLTDGHVPPTSGRLLEDLAEAGRAPGVAAIEAERGESPTPELAAPAIRSPATIREGAPITVSVGAPGAREVTLHVDGEVVGKLPVEGGLAEFRGLELEAGAHRLLAVADAPGARSVATSTTVVEGPLRVRVLGAGQNGHVPLALAVQSVEVAADAIEGPEVPDLAGTRVVVALPRFRLPADGGPLLDFVRRGGGLLVATGAAPGLSRYHGEAVSDLLPADAEPPAPEPAPPPPEPPPEEKPEEGASPAEVEKEAATLTLVLVLDRSGSMRGVKIAMARAACVAAAEELSENDRLGVLAFNESFEWILSPGPARDAKRLSSALERLQASGGTEIFPALREAHRALVEEPSSVKHVILASDGQDALMGFSKLVGSMVADRITVSAIGIGLDYDANFLGSIARWGAGQFFAATNPRDLPRVVTLDAKRVVGVARPPELEPSPDVSAGTPEPTTATEPERPTEPASEPVPVEAPAPLPFLEGLEFPDLPELSPASPRFPAQVALAGPGGEPVLLVWRYGAGRVALFTGDPDAWSGWPDLPRFLAQLSRQLAGAEGGRTGKGPLVAIRDGRIEVEVEGGSVRAFAEVAGEEAPVPLRATGPGRFAGPVPAASPGEVVAIVVRDEDGAESIAVEVAPLPPEEASRGIDDDRISSLAAAAGSPAGEIPPAPPDRKTPGREPSHLPFLVLALLAVPLDVAARRVGR